MRRSNWRRYLHRRELRRLDVATAASCLPIGPTATTISISTVTTRPTRGSTTAKLERQLTKGDFEVQDVLRVDHEAKVVDYSLQRG
jgi:hypothetical protein